MKKVLSILIITLLSLNLSANEYIWKIGEIKANIKNGNEVSEPTEPEPVIPDPSQYSSCKDILLNHPEFSGQNGVYDATIGGQLSKLYCNMTDHGGGWTAVFAQFESNAIQNWNQGAPLGYEPNLQNNVSFVLNSAQIPTHSEISFSHSNFNNSRITNIFNYQYTNGNISKTLITDKLTGINYHIYRNNTNYYTHHDPENSLALESYWTNTLTIDRTGGINYSFAFAPNFFDQQGKGFSYGGLRYTMVDAGAWLLFVR